MHVEHSGIHRYVEAETDPESSHRGKAASHNIFYKEILMKNIEIKIKPFFWLEI